jgi:hypothetical protein
VYDTQASAQAISTHPSLSFHVDERLESTLRDDALSDRPFQRLNRKIPSRPTTSGPLGNTFFGPHWDRFVVLHKHALFGLGNGFRTTRNADCQHAQASAQAVSIHLSLSFDVDENSVLRDHALFLSPQMGAVDQNLTYGRL